MLCRRVIRAVLVGLAVAVVQGAPATRPPAGSARSCGERLAALGVASPDVDVELLASLAGARDSAGKFKLVESRVHRARVG